MSKLGKGSVKREGDCRMERECQVAGAEGFDGISGRREQGP